jgi:stage II sporulation protein M
MKRGFFSENYSKCWKFGRECKWFFVFAFGLFCLTFLIGFAFPIFFREEIFMMLMELILGLEGLTTWELIGFIFLNNLQASFLAIVLGIFLGIFPVMAVVVNGYLLGFVSREAVMVDGIFAMWKILPHGIFELPAVLFSMGIGIKIGLSVVGRVRESAGKDRGVGYNFREGLRFFVFVVFPLLVVAGIIEGILIGLGS